MKTYCKPAQVNIEDWKFNCCGVYECLDNKTGRKDFQKLLCNAGHITRQDIAKYQLTGNMEKINKAKDGISKMITKRIINRDLQLKPIRQFERMDGLTRKLREICQESPEQQVMEYIAVVGLRPLFKAKILPIQYGSIPKKGQVAGKRKIERLLRKKFQNKVDVIKGDATKAYPSITVICVMRLLERDIGKNKVLLWYLGALMENYPGGHLCIGGYLPAWLFNYVMSYVLRYLQDQHQIRRLQRKPLVLAIVCYADDFCIFGHQSQLVKAMKKTTRWAKDNLGITIKNVWQFYNVSTLEAEKEMFGLRRLGSKKRTPGVDMMGYEIRRTYTIIRGRVFKRIRRQILRALTNVATLGFIPWWRACRLSAYKGWLKYSNSQNFVRKYEVNRLMRLSSKSASKHGKEVNNEKRMLLSAAAIG